MPSTADQVRQAQTPQHALLVIAESLDRIERKISEVHRVDWGDGWSTDGLSTPAEIQGLKNIVDSHEPPFSQAERLRLELVAQGNDAEAAAAARRLLNDSGGILATEKDSALDVTVGKDLISVDVPTATKEQMQERYEFATTVLKLHENFPQLGTDVEAGEAYAKGGPMWLYLSSKEGRDFMMKLPADLKRAMVQDVERFSVTDAYELGRDILKDTSPGNQDVSYGYFLDQRSDRG